MIDPQLFDFMFWSSLQNKLGKGYPVMLTKAFRSNKSAKHGFPPHQIHSSSPHLWNYDPSGQLRWPQRHRLAQHGPNRPTLGRANDRLFSLMFCSLDVNCWLHDLHGNVQMRGKGWHPNQVRDDTFSPRVSPTHRRPEPPPWIQAEQWTHFQRGTKVPKSLSTYKSKCIEFIFEK